MWIQNLTFQKFRKSIFHAQKIIGIPYGDNLLKLQVFDNFSR